MGDQTSFAAFDPLTTTASDLRSMLECRKITIRTIVQVYLDQIAKHNRTGARLNALISIAPWDKLMERADALDQELGAGLTRGPVHGIPVVVKDNVMTDWSLGMGTTCGCLALAEAKAKNSPVAHTMLEAGMIIIGKGNLTELCGSRSSSITTGWSSVGGQTQSPYVINGVVKGTKVLGHSTPGGSSSGPAVAVAAGFAPLGLGTESDGSVVQPAGRASLYSLKITVGALDTTGTSPLSKFTDCLGVMAKTPEDLALFSEVLMNKEFPTRTMRKDWFGQRIVAADPNDHSINQSICDCDDELNAKQRKDYEAALRTIGKCSSYTVPKVRLELEKIMFDNDGNELLEIVWNNDLKRNLDRFLQSYVECKVKTVEDLIRFNRRMSQYVRNPGTNQEVLEASLKGRLNESLHEMEQTQPGHEMRHNAQLMMRQLFSQNNHADLLLGPLDSRIATLAAIAGFPCGTVPLGYAGHLKHGGGGRAYGLILVAWANQETRLLEAMMAWEATISNRKPPPQLVAGFGGSGEHEQEHDIASRRKSYGLEKNGNGNGVAAVGHRRFGSQQKNTSI